MSRVQSSCERDRSPARPPGCADAVERRMKVGYFATGVLQQLDFAEFAAWGAAQGFGGIDVAPARPEQIRIARQHGLDVRATTGFACEPVTRDAAERERQQALCREAIDVAAAEGVECV